MFWLVLAGLAVVAGGLKMWGQYGKDQAYEADLKAQGKVYTSEQAAIDAQAANIKTQKQTAKQTEALNEKKIQTTATYQETNVAQQGAQAVGSQVAGAAKDNLGGASVLRRTQYIQNQTDRQLGYISGQASMDIQTQKLGLKSTLSGLNAQQAGLASTQAKLNYDENKTAAELKFQHDYGWMAYAEIGLDTAGNVLGVSPLGKDSSSLATESWKSDSSRDYSVDYSNDRYDYGGWSIGN